MSLIRTSDGRIGEVTVRCSSKMYGEALRGSANELPINIEELELA